MASTAEVIRAVTALAPTRVDLASADWEGLVPFLVANGLAPLAAYNLEYRLGDCGAPEWAKHQLLTIFQGTANDNVMKLLTLKHLLAPLEGRAIYLFDSVTFLESLYPHLAFRPLIELRIHVAPTHMVPFSNYLQRAGFEAQPASTLSGGAERMHTDGRSALFLHAHLAPTPHFDEALRHRALALKVFGPSVRTWVAEDALLLKVLMLQRASFLVPLIEYVDMRELVLGSPAQGDPRPLDGFRIRQAAKDWHLERAMYAALGVVGALFPDAREAALALSPTIGGLQRALIHRSIIAPTAHFRPPQHQALRSWLLAR